MLSPLHEHTKSRLSNPPCPAQAMICSENQPHAIRLVHIAVTDEADTLCKGSFCFISVRSNFWKSEWHTLISGAKFCLRQARLPLSIASSRNMQIKFQNLARPTSSSEHIQQLECRCFCHQIKMQNIWIERGVHRNHTRWRICSRRRNIIKGKRPGK